MGRNLRKSRLNYPDRCSYYKAVYIDNWNIKKDSISEGVFYTKNVAPISYENIILGNIKYKMKTTQLETLDNLEVYPDDFVLYKGEVWRVKMVLAEENNKEKRVSNRPSVKTQIQLERKCN